MSLILDHSYFRNESKLKDKCYKNTIENLHFRWKQDLTWNLGGKQSTEHNMMKSDYRRRHTTLFLPVVSKF